MPDSGAVAPRGAVKVLRRAIAALTFAGAIAAALRLRGRGGTPPQHGGWQPVDVSSPPPTPPEG